MWFVSFTDRNLKRVFKNTVNPPTEGLGTPPRFKDWDGVIIWYSTIWPSGQVGHLSRSKSHTDSHFKPDFRNHLFCFLDHLPHYILRYCMSILWFLLNLVFHNLMIGRFLKLNFQLKVFFWDVFEKRFLKTMILSDF